ncbi:MAG: hypothetical protein WBY44_06705 [Bryobacteraceae bacterium]|jgi:hypothetical protein
MTEARFHAKPYADVLRRVFDLSGTGMTRPLAESILALDFPNEELDFPNEEEARIEELNGKANEGLLTAEEEAELEAYVNIADLLAYWQSEARQSLGRCA